MFVVEYVNRRLTIEGGIYFLPEKETQKLNKRDFIKQQISA